MYQCILFYYSILLVDNKDIHKYYTLPRPLKPPEATSESFTKFRGGAHPYTRPIPWGSLLCMINSFSSLPKNPVWNHDDNKHILISVYTFLNTSTKPRTLYLTPRPLNSSTVLIIKRMLVFMKKFIVIHVLAILFSRSEYRCLLKKGAMEYNGVITIDLCPHIKLFMTCIKILFNTILTKSSCFRTKQQQLYNTAPSRSSRIWIRLIPPHPIYGQWVGRLIM